jgi:DNA-binding transcriptional ArsR family regulator
MLSNVRALPHPSKADFNLPGVLFALSDPTRLHIVKTLAEGGEMMCAAVDVPLCKSSCSRHYKVLREAGIIQMRRQGAAYLNSLRREELEERFPGLLAAVLRSTSQG